MKARTYYKEDEKSLIEKVPLIKAYERFCEVKKQIATNKDLMHRAYLRGQNTARYNLQELRKELKDLSHFLDNISDQEKVLLQRYINGKTFSYRECCENIMRIFNVV